MTFTKAQAETMRRQYGVPESVLVAYTNVTAEDYVTTYTQPQPEEVYGPDSFVTFTAEIIEGIGAHDEQVVDMTDVTEWSEHSEAAPWHEAGELYAIARRGADTMRQRAFAANPDVHTMPAPEFHPERMDWTTAYIFGVERERGIPAW